MDEKIFDTLVFFQSCNLEDGLWTQGVESYSGLWRINKKTGHADYMYDIFGHGCYIGIYEYENKIYMVPNCLSDEWFVYDKIGNIGEYRKLTSGINVQGRCVIKIDETIWVIPQFTNVAIVSINLRTFHYKMIDNWADPMNNHVYEIISHVSKDGKLLFFSIKDFDKFVELNTESRLITWHEIAKGKNIHDVCVSNRKIWILPNEGSEIYCMNMWTNENEKIVLHQFDVENFHFVLHQKGILFLIPFAGYPIMAYFDNKWCILDYPEGFQENTPANFWDYDIDNGKLILYPCHCNMILEIDVNTLSMIGRRIIPSVDWGEEEKMVRRERNALHSGRDIDYERSKYSLKAFLESIG